MLGLPRILLLLLLVPFSMDSSISLSGNPLPMTINTATAGSQPNSVTDTSTTYSVLSLVTATIVGSLNAALPTGVSLTVTLAPPALATSAGPVIMTTTNQTLVSGIVVLVTITGLQITYKLSATVHAAPVTNATALVTFTIQ